MHSTKTAATAAAKQNCPIHMVVLQQYVPVGSGGFNPNQFSGGIPGSGFPIQQPQVFVVDSNPQPAQPIGARSAMTSQSKAGYASGQTPPSRFGATSSGVRQYGIDSIDVVSLMQGKSSYSVGDFL